MARIFLPRRITHLSPRMVAHETRGTAAKPCQAKSFRGNRADSVAPVKPLMMAIPQ